MTSSVWIPDSPVTPPNVNTEDVTHDLSTSPQVSSTLNDYLDYNQSSTLRNLTTGDTVANLVGHIPTVSEATYSAVSYHLPTVRAGLIGGGKFVWSPSTAKSLHDGGYIVSPTVPWDKSLATLQNYLDGVGETFPSGTGCWVRADLTCLDPSHFGAVCNDTVSDSISIQACVTACITNEINLISPKRTYAYSTTVLIKDRSVYSNKLIIDFGGSSFNAKADVTLFESAYINAGNLVSNYGTPYGTTATFGLNFGNFVLTTSVGNTTAPALKLQDWHQGCYVHSIVSNYTEFILSSANNFYCEFDDISCILNTVTYAPGPCFYWEGAHNLNTFRRLIATNFDLQHDFNGLLTTCKFESMSIEGVNNGLRFRGEVYGTTFDGYIENFKLAFDFQAPVLGFKLVSGYINYLNDVSAFLIKYLPGPSNAITIGAEVQFVALPDESQIFFNKDNTSGYSLLTVERKPEFGFTLDSLIVNNGYYSTELDWDQRVQFPSARANKNNRYAVGNYSGLYTDGYASKACFDWIDNTTTAADDKQLTLRTRIVKNDTQHVYVNIKVSYVAGTAYIKGYFVGQDFYEFDGTALTKTNKLAAGNFGAFLQIDSTAFFPDVVLGCTGEVRMV